MSFRFVRATGVAVAARAVAIVGALSASGCSPPDTSERGFGSTQVLHVRDTTLALRAFSLGEAGIYLARTVPNVIVSGGISVPYDRSLLTFDTRAEQAVATGVLNAQILPTPDGRGRSLLIWHFPPDSVIPQSLSASSLPGVDFTMIDEVTGARVDQPNVDSRDWEMGATSQDPLRLRITDVAGDGKEAYWIGLPPNLYEVPPVNQIVGRDRLGLVALTSPPGGMTQSFSRIPFDGSGQVEIVPGPGGAHMVVTDPAVAVMPSSVPAAIPSGGVEPGVTCRSASTDPTGRCLLFYDRRRGMDRVPFVFDIDTAKDFELPGPLSGSLTNNVKIGAGARDIFWPAVGSTSATMRLYSWHVGDAQAASCELQGTPTAISLGVNDWRPVPAAAAGAGGAGGAGGTGGTGGAGAPVGPAQFVVVAQPNSQTSDKIGSWTLIAGTAGQECHVVAQGQNLISQLFYAPDGSAIAFLETNPIGVSKLYVTDGDAGPPRLVAAGAIFFNIDFHDPRHLLLWYSNTDGYSVSWLDLSTTPATEHPIADRVSWGYRGSWAWINPRWVLLADQDSLHSGQPGQQPGLDDGSFSLNVVDLETGTRKLVSRGVVDFRVPWTTPPDGATTLTVAYTVRSQTPSSQDGIWAARLPLADFPP